MGEQFTGQTVGTAVERPVTHLMPGKDQCDALRMGGRKLFEALMHHQARCEYRLGLQQSWRGQTLRRAEQRQAEHRLRDILEHRFEQGMEMLGKTLDGGAVEEVAGVLDDPGESAVFATQGQHQVELCGFMGL